MCFGNSQTTQTVQTTVPKWLSGAAQSNLSYAQNLQNTGFQPYTGQQVAAFSPQQQSSFGFATDIANGVQPYAGETGQLLNNYATAGPQSVSANPIYSNMSPYMNAYVNQALAPQLQLEAQQFAGQNKNFDSAATSAGAYGDTGWNLGRTNLTQQQDVANQGLIGNAYNAAFNTAIGAGAQDTANELGAATTNANLAETALGRQLMGAYGLNNVGTGAANLENTFGGQQTAQSQAQLNAPYNQWLMAQQYPFQTIQALNQSVAAGSQGANKTQTTSSPDNSGFGLLGSLAPIIAAPFTGGASLMALPATTAMSANPGNFGGTGGSLGGFYADGGTPPAGKPVVVGERGPEVFVPNTTGVIVPNEVLEAAREKRAKKTKRAPHNFGLAA